MREWQFESEGTSHTVVFKDVGMTGNVRIVVDGTMGIYNPVLIRDIGMFCIFYAGKSEMILALDMKNKPTTLIQNGVSLDGGETVRPEVIKYVHDSAAGLDRLAVKERAKTGSFLTMVVMTYLNIILIVLNAPISFPFSAFVPQLLTVYAVGDELRQPLTPAVFAVFIGIALIMATGYFVLYLLSKKRMWPIVTALVFFILDTLPMFLSFGADSYMYAVLNIVFHGWVIYSFVTLIIMRHKRAKQIHEALSKPVAAENPEQTRD